MDSGASVFWSDMCRVAEQIDITAEDEALYIEKRSKRAGVKTWWRRGNRAQHAYGAPAECSHLD